MKKNNRGFTLAELLIVVAIIAVLVAIAIPIFTTQLEKSKETTDIANLRSAYAAATVTALTGQYGQSGTLDTTAASVKLYYNPSADGSLDANGIAIGQGTATNGRADVSGLGTSGIMQYSNTTDVKGQRIECEFQNGELKTVKYVAVAAGG